MKKVGDQVSWSRRRRVNGVIEMTLKEGMVEAIAGDMAVVKCGRSRYHVPLERLRTPGEKSEIQDVIEAMRGNAGQL